MVDENLSYEEVPIVIFERHVESLRNKENATVMVLRTNHLVEGALWEGEADMRSWYAYILCSRGNTSYS